MSLATLTRRMADAGASAELVAIVMEEVEALQLSLDARRIADRDRKRLQRLKSANVTGQSEDSHGTVTPISAMAPSAFDKEIPPAPPKEIKSTTPVHIPCAKAWHRLPEGWVPTRDLPAPVQAKVDQWPPGALEDELAAFRRWAANAENKNGKGRKLDWDQAWRNWIGRRHDERYSKVSGNRQSLTGGALAEIHAELSRDCRAFG